MWPLRLTSATIVTASVLAPRLIVKEPAIGQRSIFAESIRELEVISFSDNSEPCRLARRNQVWLVRDVLYKTAAGRGGYFLFSFCMKCSELAREFAS